VGEDFGEASYEFKGCFGEPISDSLQLLSGTYGGIEHTRYTASECKVTKPHTEITCQTAPGTGKDHKWVANVGEQLSEAFLYTHLGRTMRYRRPIIYKVFGPAISGGSTRGNEILFIGGNYFGPLADIETEISSYNYGHWPSSWMKAGDVIEDKKLRKEGLKDPINYDWSDTKCTAADNNTTLICNSSVVGIQANDWIQFNDARPHLIVAIGPAVVAWNDSSHTAITLDQPFNGSTQITEASKIYVWGTENIEETPETERYTNDIAQLRVLY
jgi:hypothetical protein